MKRKIKYVDLDELNSERLGLPGSPVKLDFLPSPEQVRKALREVKVTISLPARSFRYYEREARRRRQSPAELMQRVLETHARVGD
ncbi:MAG: hypothetical protein RMK20_01180 [Verrucomicrobiales bacterium]|nr:hypothetical protein [Verrucomicrobiales bacterium]